MNSLLNAGGNMDFSDFKKFLAEKKSLTTKTVWDVVSRYKRAMNMASLSQGASQESILDRLNENLNFRKLSYSVKSQLRRSVRLYKEYQKSTRK